MAFLELKQISKKLDQQPVLNGIDLSVGQGEFVTLLGPSGCGKSTLLRIICGLLRPDAGSVELNGQPLASVPPRERGMGMIFQSYSLFPTMTVYDNVAFGLTTPRRKRSGGQIDIDAAVRRVLQAVHMTEHLHKYPAQLSGGEQQRVALARSLVISPAVMLLDEPFSAIDAQLRRKLQAELRELHQAYGMTSIFVTHDQEEAMLLSDRIILMNAGEIVQQGTPDELYRRPNSVFAATFIGNNNLLTPQDAERLGFAALPPADRYAIRAEQIRIASAGEADAAAGQQVKSASASDILYVAGTLTACQRLGAVTRCSVRTDIGILQAEVIADPPLSHRPGDNLLLRICRKDLAPLS